MHRRTTLGTMKADQKIVMLTLMLAMLPIGTRMCALQPDRRVGNPPTRGCVD